nr:uncharacterized protein LOC128695568 [Cherax quadricarinatus]
MPLADMVRCTQNGGGWWVPSRTLFSLGYSQQCSLQWSRIFIARNFSYMACYLRLGLLSHHSVDVCPLPGHPCCVTPLYRRGRRGPANVQVGSASTPGVRPPCTTFIMQVLHGEDDCHHGPPCYLSSCKYPQGEFDCHPGLPYCALVIKMLLY